MENNNLDFVTPTTKARIKYLLDSPSVHDTTKNIIKQGLKKDCLDAYTDAFAAAEALKMVMLDCI